MAIEKSGEEKARETAEKLKRSTKENQEIAAAKMKITLADIEKNEELSRLYHDNADVGASNLSGESPILKVHATGKSSTNELANGREPQDGSFFYKPTRSEYDDVVCHILTISRGFRAEGLVDPATGKKKLVFNQVVGGVIINDGDMKPFIMYVTGVKLSRLWAFGKEAAKFTRRKPMPIPLFALTVHMTTEKVADNYGKNWVINFEVMKGEDDEPLLVSDPADFVQLRDGVEKIEDTIEKVISAKMFEDAPADPGASQAVHSEPVDPGDGF